MTCRLKLLWVLGVLFFCCARLADSAPSAANSCLAEVGASDCGLSSALSMVAGDEVSVLVLASDDAGARCTDDCASGLVSASLGGNAADAITYNGNGMYYLHWNRGSVRVAGSLALNVEISSAAVSGSPATVACETGQASASGTHVYDNPSAGGVVGQDITFSLQARDTYGNDLTVAPTQFSYIVKLQPIDVAAVVTPRGNGQYSVSYSCTTSGDYTLTVRSSDLELNTVYDVTLTPGDADLSKFSGSGVTTGDAGALAQYVVQGRDAYGNALTADAGASFSVTVSQSVDGQYEQVSGQVSVAYSSEGRYDLTFTLTASGLYSVDILSAGTSTPTQIAGSPFTRAVRPAVRSAGDCIVTGNVIVEGGVGTLSAGANAQISVTSVDAYGNRYTSGDTAFSLAISGPATCSGTFGAAGDGGSCSILFTRSSAAGGSGDGSSVVTFILTLSGTYSLGLTLTDTHTTAGATLGSSPYQVTISADPSADGTRVAHRLPELCRLTSLATHNAPCNA